MQPLMSSNKPQDRNPIVFLTEDTVPLSRSEYDPFRSDRPFKGSEWHEIPITRDPATERAVRDNLKWYLLNKYRTVFIDKLTPEDLDELQYYHKRQYDPKHGWNTEYLHKFVQKLREYMHDEILKKEIAGIESLVTLMKPEDLRDR
jgi:hypothetical protein